MRPSGEAGQQVVVGTTSLRRYYVVLLRGDSVPGVGMEINDVFLLPRS